MAKTGPKVNKDQKKRKDAVKAKKKRILYSPRKMRDAVHAVVHRGMAQSVAAKIFNVPRTTLNDKLTGRTIINKRPGPIPTLPAYVENAVVDYIKNGIARGFLINVSQLSGIVQNIIQLEEIHTNFKNNRPGRSWCSSFFTRHPELSLKKGEHHSRARASVTEDSIRRWFHNLKQYLQEHDESLITDPSRWFNFDETACFVAATRGTYIGLAGQSLQSLKNNSEKENYSVGVCFSATGNMAPLQLILEGKRMPASMTTNNNDQLVISLADSGWQTGASFLHYLKSFTSYLKEMKLLDDLSKKVILLVDNHKSHEDFHVSKYCEKVGIILYALFPNSTHILQPADVGIMQPFKTYWTQELQAHHIRTQGAPVKKYHLPQMLTRAIGKVSVEVMINAFRACGLQPLNADAPHYESLLSSKTKATVQVNPELEKAYMLLAQEIPQQVLDSFHLNINENDWKGDPEDTNLFKTWKRIWTKVYRSTASPAVTPLPASPAVTPLPPSPTVTSLPASPAVTPLPPSPAVSPCPASPAVSPCPASPAVSPCPASPAVSPCPASPAIISLPASPSDISIPASRSHTPTPVSPVCPATQILVDDSVFNETNETLRLLCPPVTDDEIIIHNSENESEDEHIVAAASSTVSEQVEMQSGSQIISILDTTVQKIQHIPAKKMSPASQALLSFMDAGPSKFNKRKKLKVYNLSSKEHRRTKHPESDSDEEEWQCYKCHRLYFQDKSNLPWVQCDGCKNTMHVKCVSSKHKKKTSLLEKIKTGEEYDFMCSDCSD